MPHLWSSASPSLCVRSRCWRPRSKHFSSRAPTTTCETSICRSGSPSELASRPHAAHRARFPFALELRTPLAELGEGAQLKVASRNGRIDLGSDFESFWRQVEGVDALEQVKAAFELLRPDQEVFTKPLRLGAASALPPPTDHRLFGARLPLRDFW